MLDKYFFNAGKNIKDDLFFLYRLGGDDDKWINIFSEVIEESSNPERFIVGFVNYVRVFNSVELLVRKCLEDKRFLRLFERVFSQSPFLGELIIKYPELPFGTYGSKDINRVLTSDEWIDSLNLPINFQSEEEVISYLRERGLISLQGGRYDLKPLMDYLRWGYKKCLFRIAVRDIVFHQDVVSVAEDLSNLADGLLGMVYKVFYSLYSSRYGKPQIFREGSFSPECRFVILAMGKLGGRELNFSSDIDLLFLYEGEGETQKGISNREFFSWLCQDLIRFFSEHTEAGIIYRVDMRLRPYGKVGSLVETISNAVEYYYQYGRAWERQALVKCRPCAGDSSLGIEFIERMRPFVFPKFFDDKTLEDISRTKALAERHSLEQGKGVYDVKLGKGGIRDIEFTVQVLQMLNGGRSESLRVTNTIEAIRNLAMEGYLKVFDADTLIRNYKFLREVEHRLQIEYGTQKHQLPESKELLDEIAKRLGYSSGEAFLNIYLHRTAENRKILENFLSFHAAGNLWVYELISKGQMDEELYARLREYRFKNAERAKELFVSLVDGPPNNLNPLHIRESVIKIIPSLCEQLSRMKDPDLALERFCYQMLKIPMPGAVYSILNENVNICKVFVYLTFFAPSLSDIWLRNPGVLEVLFEGDTYTRVPTKEDLKNILESMKRSANPLSAHYRLKDEEFVRIATGDILGNYSVFDVGRQLTQVAELILQDIAEDTLNEFMGLGGGVDVSFAILGLGKIGGGEMTYGSDLDLVFVYDDISYCKNGMLGRGLSGVSMPEFFSRVASRIIERLKQPTQFGSLYDVDPRLRPYGSKGILAISLNQLKDYYEHEAEIWEKMALMKARVVFERGTILGKVQSLINKCAFNFPVSMEDIQRSEEIRLKMVHQSSHDNLKKSEGGIAELEYSVRWWQRLKIDECPELATPSVVKALDFLSKIIPEKIGKWQFLKETFETYLKIINRCRLFTGARSSTLSSEILGLIPELLPEISFVPTPYKYLENLKEEVHQFYLETLGVVQEWVKSKN